MAGQVGNDGGPPKRRLPVLQGPAAGEDEGPDRPPWQWAGLGVVASFLAWLPLASIAGAIVKAWVIGPGEAGSGVATSGATTAAIFALHVAAFALAAFAGGVFVGRFGASAGAREAAGSGLLTALIAWAVTAFASAPTPASFWGMLLALVAAVGAVSGYVGGKAGKKLRRR